MLKTLVYFIDGATWKLLDVWLAEGKLPNLAKLKSESAYGKLESVFPPTTHTALPAFFTGKSPISLGLFNMEELEAAMLRSDNFTGQFLWDKLTGSGFRSLVMDIPFTYPPKPFNGVLFTGFYTPQEAADFAWPEEIAKKYPDYPKGGVEMMNYVYKSRFDADLLSAEFEITEKRFSAFVSELKSGNFDFACFYVKATDILQHFFWNKKDEILKFYEMLDGQIGIMRQSCNAENFVVLSDHGFDDAPKEVFFTNAWLEENGYLKWRSGYDNFLTRKVKDILSNNKKISKIFYYLLWLLKTKRQKEKIEKKKEKNDSNNNYMITGSVDTKNSRAYAVGGALRGKGIIINVSDPAEKEKLKEEIVGKLKKEVYGGAPAIQFVKKKEEMSGAGESGYYLPDIFFLPHRRMVADDRYSNKIINRRKTHSCASGHHLSSPDGIFMWQGSNVNAGDYGSLSLLDVHPTLLNVFGIAPINCDGRAISGIFIQKNKIIESRKTEDGDLINDIIL
jgi:predicted AlkP superfamily phosphohydrolase/phosphomutase